ncbi:MAG: YWFCY domain-containing protein [Sediminibacterium sp.]|nr:YWFCY domain-containing protein [Sediminibacterium sp.]
MSTGENDQDLRKILDMTRWLSIAVLLLHFYYFCYGAFVHWRLYSEFSDNLLLGVARTGLFAQLQNAKIISLLLLIVSLLGTQGRKDEDSSVKLLFVMLGSGLLLYFLNSFILRIDAQNTTIGCAYMFTSTLGYILVLGGGIRASRLIQQQLKKDVFNEINETFPQEERMLTNEYSINFSGSYRLQQTTRKSRINIINPFRGLLVTGSPGAGKSWFVILPLIKQQIEKGFGMFIYDFKYDDLSRAAYNWLQLNKSVYAHPPAFYAINFDNLLCSQRCNPLDPKSMYDITDATESARTILLGLNREWIKKQGDFFVESPINFVTAVIWFLRKFEDGRYCTLPHVIELMQAQYDDLFPVLNTIPEIEVLVNPFITAFQNDAMEQLEGQIASAKIGMARLASPQMYWVLSGNDFTLDINDPLQPKVICVGNNPEKQSTYGAVLSLYISRLIKIVNKKGKQKCSLVFDEFPTIFFNNMDGLIATARSNKVATTLAMQDFSQLRKDYGKEQADVITNICGNIISGQVTGDTAKMLSERFGKIVQQKESMSINRTDTSTSKSWQLEHAMPASKISALSSGEFVGMVADDPNEKIKLKMFHAEFVQDTKKINEEIKTFKPIPKVYDISSQDVLDNYFQIKLDIKNLVENEVNRLIAERDAQRMIQ